MTAPNIVAVATISGKTAVQAVGTSATAIVTNSSGSGKVQKVNALFVSNINTAAATPKGEFLFNKKFMQELMDFAMVEGLHPKGKKYVSNGGNIPDCYAYIEFLIIHELLHALFPQASEEVVEQAGKDLAKVLHICGYREQR